jgi:hypothetical protein
MAHRPLNLPGTHEFFDIRDAQKAADLGMIRPGAIVMVEGKAFKALYYDEEKRVVLVGGPDYTLGSRDHLLLPADKRRK